MDIGFIGLGNMGAHMARRLIEAGHRVVVYDSRQEAIGNLAALGAVAARSPAEQRSASRYYGPVPAVGEHSAKIRAEFTLPPCGGG